MLCCVEKKRSCILSDEAVGHVCDKDITLFERKHALLSTSPTSPGQDEVCYI